MYIRSVLKQIKCRCIGTYGELGRYIMYMYIDIVQQCRRHYIHLENNKETLIRQKVYQMFKKSNTPKTRSPNRSIFNFNKPYENFIIWRRYRELWACQVHTEHAQCKVGQNKLRSYENIKN